jgi:hypothetical protein
VERTRVLVVFEKKGYVEQAVIDTIRELTSGLVDIVELEKFDELPSRVRDGRIDCVLAWLKDGSIPSQIAEAHERGPGVRFVGLVGEPGNVRFYEIAPDGQTEGQLGIAQLAALIRGKRPLNTGPIG